MFRDVVLIGSASGAGAPDSRCGDGPLALARKGALPCFGPLARRYCPPVRLIRPSRDSVVPVDRAVAEVCGRISDEVEQVLASHGFPVVIGGDHSCAMGTWAGVHRATRAAGELGLIWVDAHMDSHRPETSHSGQLHGMPLAALMGYGDQALIRLGGDTHSISPAHVCLLGVRSFEPEERELLDRLGVRFITMSEIEDIGFAAAWAEAYAIATRGTCGFGVSIDLDAIDPEEAPGVGSPVAHGVHAADLIVALGALRDAAQLLALEITEYNPYRDPQNATAALLARLITSVAD